MRNWTKRWRRVTWKGFPAFKHERESYDLEGKSKLVVSSFISSLSPSTTNTEGLSEEEERILLEKVLISSTQIRCKCGYGLDILNSCGKYGNTFKGNTAPFIIHISQNRWRPCLKRSLTTTTRTVFTSQLDPLSFFQRFFSNFFLQIPSQLILAEH